MTNDKTNQFYFSKVRYMCNFTPEEVAATVVPTKSDSDVLLCLSFTIAK